MGSPENIFSYCVGGLALISTIFSVLFCCRLYLPTTQLKCLDELLVETKEIYRKSKEEDLLRPDASRLAATRLNRYDDECDTLREVTYRTRSSIDILRTFFRGHTRRIMRLADKVARLRAFLMTTSQEEKTRRAQELELRQNQTVPSELDNEDDGTPSPAHVDNINDPSKYPLRAMTIDQSTDKNCPGPTCILCAFMKWIEKLSPKNQSLPSFFAGGEDQSPPTISSRTSTMVNEVPQKFTWRPFFSLGLPASVLHWKSLGRRPDPVQKLNPDDSPLSHHDSPATLPV